MKNMQLHFRLPLIMASVLVLQSCSYIGLDTYFRDRSNDYRKAEAFPPMEVPAEMDERMLGQTYPVPEGGEVVEYEIESEFEVPRPRSIALNESATEVKIQSLGEATWILLSEPPGEAWPRIRSYLTRVGIPTARADASRGVIETGLFQLNQTPDQFQQFRIQLAQGVQLNSTEIDIRHRSFAEGSVPDELPAWPSESVNREYETWLRDDLANALAAGDATGAASLLGQEIGADEKVVMVTPDPGYPYIEMRLDYERAWASVSYALAREGFTLVESQKGEGVLLADYQPPDTEKPSWWRRLLRVGNEPPVSHYRVKLDVEDDSVQVRVENTGEQQMSQRENFLVLQRIRNNLG